MTAKAAVFLALSLAIAAPLALGCSEGEEDQETPQAPRQDVRQGMLTDSLQAFAELESYEVQAAGELRQGGTTAHVKLSFEFVAPDRLRFLSESTSGGRTDRAGLVIVGERSWTLEGEAWVEQPPPSLDIRVFSAERLWGLVPFASATLLPGQETVNGAQARHFRFKRSAQLSFEPFAGALLAGTEPRFTGDLTQFTIDYWTDAAGKWPLRMQLTAEGGDRRAELTVSLTRVNDPSIRVEPP